MLEFPWQLYFNSLQIYSYCEMSQNPISHGTKKKFLKKAIDQFLLRKSQKKRNSKVVVSCIILYGFWGTVCLYIFQSYFGLEILTWSVHTDSTKINRPGHNIRMYLTNFEQPIAHVQQIFFGKTLIEVGSSHLYASFGTFCIQIDQVFAPQWVFKHSEEFRNQRHFPSKTANCRFSNILQRLTVPRIIDQF